MLTKQKKIVRAVQHMDGLWCAHARAHLTLYFFNFRKRQQLKVFWISRLNNKICERKIFSHYMKHIVDTF